MRKTFRIFSILIIIVASIAMVAAKYDAYRREDRIRSAVLDYLVQPHYASADLLEQVSGVKATFEMFDLDEGKIYLSVPQERYSSATPELLTRHPERVEFATTGKYGVLQLGSYRLRKPQSIFFRFPSRDFRVTKKEGIRIPYRKVEYQLSLDELVGIEGSTYDGASRFYSGESEEGLPVVVANHGAFVGRKGDPSLSRFVSALTSNARTKETTAQCLLDFVTTEIAYDGEEASWIHETMKRPHEVLMSRKSDCSGKAILYASLLEQTSIEYYLVYFPAHIAVFVEGEYDDLSGKRVTIAGKKFAHAETTDRGFRIGTAWMLDERADPKKIRFIQRPGLDSKVLDTAGRSMRFAMD
jgi:hypothetical protein